MTNTGSADRADDQGELAYHERGTGAVLVLLHGFGGSGRNWDPFADELARHYRLIIVDLPGHGASPMPPRSFTHRSAAHAVFQLLDRLKIDQFSAMGISSGGMTLLHMATSQPRRVDSMVLISATTHFTPQARAIFHRASYQTLPAQVLNMYRDCATRGDDQVRQLIAQFHAFGDNRDDMNFTAQDLSVVTARTLIVHGDRDQFFPVEIAVNLYRALARSQLWIIPGGDHVPLGDAEAFTAAALRFLGGSDTGSPL